MNTYVSKLCADFLAAILDFQNGVHKILTLAIFWVSFNLNSSFMRLNICFLISRNQIKRFLKPNVLSPSCIFQNGGQKPNVLWPSWVFQNGGQNRTKYIGILFFYTYLSYFYHINVFYTLGIPLNT